MRRRYYLKMKLGEENKKNILLYKQTKNEKYKEKIILDNRKLSLVIFNKYKEMYKINSCISLQDLKEELIQEGDLALSIAIDEFDANKGIEFSTYAYTVIENAFYHYFSKNKNLIRLPKKTEILISKVKNAIIKLKELNKDYSNSTESGDRAGRPPSEGCSSGCPRDGTGRFLPRDSACRRSASPARLHRRYGPPS